MKNQAKAIAGSLGGKARMSLYGNPGTEEGRKLGGKRSLITHQARKTGFKTLRDIAIPPKSERLAELMGILAGDGHVSEYQVSVVTSSETDSEHASYTQALLQEMFLLPVSVSKRNNSNVLTVLLSSKKAADFLRGMGMTTSHKTRDQLQPPEWIRKDTGFKKAFVRGLVDTDGCVYLDKHKIKEKEYSSLCIAFTNASAPLLDFVYETWKELGYKPTRFGRDARLRRRKEVLRYAEEIGFNNPKHARKIGL